MIYVKEHYSVHRMIIINMIKNAIVFSTVLKDKLEFKCLRIDTKRRDLSILIIEPYNYNKASICVKCK